MARPFSSTVFPFASTVLAHAVWLAVAVIATQAHAQPQPQVMQPPQGLPGQFQDPAPEADAAVHVLEELTVSAPVGPVFDASQAEVGGFVAPLADTPQSVSVLGADLLATQGAQSLSQAARLDASLSDSYNTVGFPESLGVRGFTLQSVGNYQRNGLVTNHYAPLGLENKERVEVLKGVAGLQTGVSAPGGLVNYVSKMPLEHDLSALALQLDGNAGAKAHVDLSRRIGADDAGDAAAGVGLRLNVAAERLRPHFDDADGSRELASLAVDVLLSAQTRLTGELEYQRKSQPSVPGLSLLDVDGDGAGEALPPFVYTDLNLNSQPWSQPYQMRSSMAQVGLAHAFNDDWRARLGVSWMQTRIHDRIAFPDGCGTGNVYPGMCANGDVDLYDFRNEGIKTRLASWDATLEGRTAWGGREHRLKLGAAGHGLSQREAAMQTYNWVGTTNIHNPVMLPADPQPGVLNTNRDEQSLAAFASINTHWNAQWQSFAGIRITRMDRSSARTDGSNAVQQKQTVTTPWLGLAYKPQEAVTVYASWGRGAELAVAPNRPALYANAGQVLPALKSSQSEVGLKWQASERLLLSAAAFEIEKPMPEATRLPGNALPSYLAGGKEARHRGVELNAAGQVSRQWSVQASATWLNARYSKAFDPALIGQRVTNVPSFAASVLADYKVAAVPGLSFNGLLWLQNGKRATADGQTVLPRAWQFDAGARYEHDWGDTLLQWSLGVENLTNRAYWREAAHTEWDGVYLFPAAPRTVRATLRVQW